MILKKIYGLIPSTQKKKILLLSILTATSIFFDIFSLGLVIPLIGILLGLETFDQDYFSYLPILEPYLQKFEAGILISILFLFGVILKNILVIVSTKYSYQIGFNTEKYLSSKILTNYLFSPFSFFVKNNTSKLLHNLTQEIWKTQVIIVSSFQLIAELIIVIAIIIFLMIINFKITLILITSLSVFSLVFVTLYKKKLTIFGEEKVKYETYRMRQLGEVFGGIKDVILKDAQKGIIKKFNENYDLIIKPTVFISVLRVIPRIWIEISFICGVSIFLIFILLSKQDVMTILPNIIFFTVCLIRILPAVSKILFTFQTINFGSATINLITNELNLINKSELQNKNYNNKMSPIFNEKIIIKDLNFSYGSRSILKNINFEIKKNTIIGITGKSGSGKSTLLNIILGLITDYKGEILIDNQNQKLSKNAIELINWRNKLGYISQSVFINDDTLRKNIAIGVEESEIDETKIDQCIKLSRIDDFINELEKKKDTNLGQGGIKLSGGQIQRIGLARSLYADPNILVLDEPTSALGNKTEEEIFLILKNLKKTVVVVTHSNNNLKHCDSVYHLDNTKIIKIK
jgi:ABC-type multidrug transport system fused ATPase/permease subunit